MSHEADLQGTGGGEIVEIDDRARGAKGQRVRSQGATDANQLGDGATFHHVNPSSAR